MKLATTRSPKFRRLMNLAGISRVQAAGTLELLWLFTIEQAPAGDVGRWSDSDIEAELDWQGAEGALVAALVSAGWLDRCAVHRLVIHDWADHAPEFLRKRSDRGRLALAAVTPCPDNGGHCPPTADNGGQREEVAAVGGIREEKSSQEKPSQEKPRESAAEPAPAPAERAARTRSDRKARETAVPDKLSDADRARVLQWAEAQSPPITQHALTYAWKVYLAKARAKQYRYADHARGFINALGAAGEAWALKGYEPPAGPGGGASRYRDAESVLAEARRKQREDDERARGQAGEAEQVAKVIELSLRQAAGGA